MSEEKAVSRPLPTGKQRIRGLYEEYINLHLLKQVCCLSDYNCLQRALPIAPGYVAPALLQTPMVGMPRLTALLHKPNQPPCALTG